VGGIGYGTWSIGGEGEEKVSKVTWMPLFAANAVY